MLAAKLSSVSSARASRLSSSSLPLKPQHAKIAPARKLGITSTLSKIRTATVAATPKLPVKMQMPVAPVRVRSAPLPSVQFVKRDRRDFSGSTALITNVERFAEGSTMWGMLVALMLCISWAMYEEEVQAAEGDAKKKSASPASTASPSVPAAAAAPVAEAAKADENISRFNIYECQVLTPWQRFVIFGVTLCTAGLGFFVLYPLFQFNFLKENTERANLDGKKIKFTGDLTEFWLIYLENTVLTMVTCGFYALLGYSERKTARYIDAHLQYV